MPPTASEIRRCLIKAQEQPNEITQNDLHILSGALVLRLRDSDPVADRYAQAYGTDMQHDVVVALGNVRVDFYNPATESLLRTFERNDKFYEAMHSLLDMAVSPSHSGILQRSSLTSMQQEILSALAVATTIWLCDPTLPDRLVKRGLPTTRHKLNRMLGLMAG